MRVSIYLQILFAILLFVAVRAAGRKNSQNGGATPRTIDRSQSQSRGGAGHNRSRALHIATNTNTNPLNPQMNSQTDIRMDPTHLANQPQDRRLAY